MVSWSDGSPNSKAGRALIPRAPPFGRELTLAGADSGWIVVVAKDGQEVEEEAGREMIKKLEKHAEHMFELELRRDRDRDRDHGGKDFGGDGYHGFPRGGGTRGRGYRGSYRSRGRGRGYVKTEDRD